MRHIKKFNESKKKFTYGFTIDIEGCTKPNIEKKKDVYEDIASKIK